MRLEGVAGARYMYHDPCHTPMKTYAPLAVVNELMGTKVALNERCCGESGTLAVSRPDISTQVRFRKEEEMRRGAAALRADGFAGDVKVLTSCPSCLQGLSRFADDAGTDADYIVVEIAKRMLGAELDGGLRREGQRGRHRARAGLTRVPRAPARRQSGSVSAARHDSPNSGAVAHLARRAVLGRRGRRQRRRARVPCPGRSGRSAARRARTARTGRRRATPRAHGVSRT